MVLAYRAELLAIPQFYTLDSWKETHEIEAAAWAWHDRCECTGDELKYFNAVGDYLRVARANIKAAGFAYGVCRAATV